MNSVRRRRPNGKGSPTRRVLRTLVADCEKPADLIEVYYWSKEPGLPEIIRAIAMMSDQTRAAIEAFVALAQDAKTVTGYVDARGVLMLASANAARAVALVEHAAEEHAASEDTEDSPTLLN